jgi:hypothetical protein
VRIVIVFWASMIVGPLFGFACAVLRQGALVKVHLSRSLIMGSWFYVFDKLRAAVAVEDLSFLERVCEDGDGSIALESYMRYV